MKLVEEFNGKRRIKPITKGKTGGADVDLQVGQNATARTNPQQKKKVELWFKNLGGGSKRTPKHKMLQNTEQSCTKTPGGGRRNKT